MKSLSFRKDLVGVQDELLRFAYKLTTDREEANDLLQETSLKALDNEDKYTPDTKMCIRDRHNCSMRQYWKDCTPKTNRKQRMPPPSVSWYDKCLP